MPGTRNNLRWRGHSAYPQETVQEEGSQAKKEWDLGPPMLGQPGAPSLRGSGRQRGPPAGDPGSPQENKLTRGKRGKRVFQAEGPAGTKAWNMEGQDG